MVLAAGEGTRLRPLTDLLPKPLCPVGNEPLLRRVIRQVLLVCPEVWVNAHMERLAVAEMAIEMRLSFVLEERLLGTAGGVANIAAEMPGRPFLVANGDAWREGDGGLPQLLDGWDGERPRLLVVDDPDRADFDERWRFAGASLLPAADAADLRAEPSGLYETVWAPARAADRLELVPWDGAYFDCGTPAEYLAANLHASGGANVIGEGARVDGEVVECVVWPGARVAPGERLVRAIRAGTAAEPVTVETEPAP